jgi:hypothetical protein
VCDRVTILYGGQQRAAGPTRELLSQTNLTQITTEKLAPETIEKVRQLVQSNTGRKVLSVSSPSDTLESFFLRIVAEAEAANVITSGVRESGELPDFLGGSPPSEQVIESLVSAARAPQRVEPASAGLPKPAQKQPSQKVIEQLTERPKPASAPQGPKPVPAREASQKRKREPTEADRSIIDSLTKKPDRRDDGQETATSND